MSPLLAGVIGSGSKIDDLVAGFAATQHERGWWIRGLVQESRETGHRRAISLVDLDNGGRYPITHDLGQGSVACKLDAAGLAEASSVMRRIAAEGADLAIFNRFSSQEIAGRGLAAEMLTLAMQGIPLLTIVPERHLQAWQHFTGGLSVELAPTRSALERWFYAIQPVRICLSEADQPRRHALGT